MDFTINTSKRLRPGQVWKDAFGTFTISKNKTSEGGYRIIDNRGHEFEVLGGWIHPYKHWKLVKKATRKTNRHG